MEGEAEKTYHFPMEVLTRILAHVDPRTVVFSCRLVCRFWRDAVECSELWKLQILREHGDKFESDRALTTAHLDYPWYICYSLCSNVFDRNLFIRSEGLPPTWLGAHNAGIMWSAPFNSCTEGFARAPQELSNEEENECFLCVIGKNSKDHTVDLYAHRLTRKIMELQPSIHISEWFTVRPGNFALAHIEVRLCNSDGQFDRQRGFVSFVHGLTLDWYKVSYTFTNYGPDVRYVVFRHGIDTTVPPYHEIFYLGISLQHVGKIAGTKLIVSRPEPSDPYDSTSSSSIETIWQHSVI